MNTNKALVLAGIKGVFIDRDPTVLDRLFSDDYQQHNPQIPNGTAAIKALLETFRLTSGMSQVSLWRRATMSPFTAAISDGDRRGRQALTRIIRECTRQRPRWPQRAQG